MDLIFYLLITVLVFVLFLNFLPFLAPILLVIFIINFLRRAFLRRQFKKAEEDFNEQPRSNNSNVIDVEYTEREDDGE